MACIKFLIHFMNLTAVILLNILASHSYTARLNSAYGAGC